MEQSEPEWRFVFRNTGNADGIIIATIIASHMTRKLKAEPNQVWPCMRIHIIDMVQPPDICSSQHMERQNQMVAEMLAMKARRQTTRNPAGSVASSELAKLLYCS